jgi:hypothetical protein
LISGCIPKYEVVDKTGRIVALLPDLLTERAWLVRTYVSDKRVDRGQNLLERFGVDLVAGKLANFSDFSIR